MNTDEHEYIKVEVTRTESTDLYLKVPKGWRPSGKHTKLLAQAVTDTVESCDWDNFDWESTVEAQGYKLVSDEEADFYATFDVCSHLNRQTPENP